MGDQGQSAGCNRVDESSGYEARMLQLHVSESAGGVSMAFGSGMRCHLHACHSRCRMLRPPCCLVDQPQLPYEPVPAVWRTLLPIVASEPFIQQDGEQQREVRGRFGCIKQTRRRTSPCWISGCTKLIYNQCGERRPHSDCSNVTLHSCGVPSSPMRGYGTPV